MLLTGLPRSATALLGIMETFFGVGYMAGEMPGTRRRIYFICSVLSGPAIGLALYGVGGFKVGKCATTKILIRPFKSNDRISVAVHCRGRLRLHLRHDRPPHPQPRAAEGNRVRFLSFLSP